MKRAAQGAIRKNIEDEFSGAEFGDKRLGARLVEIARRMSRDPERSFPQASSNSAELEATYRFLNNHRIAPDAVLAPHIRETVRRCRACKHVVVAHDTTEFNFGKSARRDLGRVGLGKSFGFYGHFALAVEADEGRLPLGVVGLAVHQRQGGKKRYRSRLDRQNDPTNERRRWGQLVDDTALVLESIDPVHVMDREADSYTLMAKFIAEKRRFVIRMGPATRRVVDDESVAKILEGAATLAERTVPISTRGSSPLPSYRKLHPKRKARLAHLQVSGSVVTLSRPRSASLSKSEVLTINVVRVTEPNPPPNEVPVEWRLWTTEPIENEEDVLRVVDFYRCRWRIEEFFKAMKSGCAIEQRQLESRDGLINTVALMTPIAWSLLRLRSYATEQPGVLAEHALSARQLLCLDAALKERRRPGLPKNPTARDAMLGVAALGGHIPNNGDPGWIVLGRGFDDLLMIELGFILATGADTSDQS